MTKKIIFNICTVLLVLLFFISYAYNFYMRGKEGNYELWLFGPIFFFFLAALAIGSSLHKTKPKNMCVFQTIACAVPLCIFLPGFIFHGELNKNQLGVYVAEAIILSLSFLGYLFTIFIKEDK